MWESDPISEQVVIEHRFRGPKESAHGGYACGVVAAAIEPGPAVEVTLRTPPPLDRGLTLERGNGGAELRDGEALVAEGTPVELPALEPPDPVSLEDAEAARRDSPFQSDHPFSECFVCGPDREPGDGLRVVCGPIAGREQGLVAAPWETDAAMAGSGGAIQPELVWSVLDCPSGIAAMLVPGLGVAMLGRLTALLEAPIEAGPDYIAIGWLIDRDGRKLEAGSAILDGDGNALAQARATWIELRD